MESVMLENGNKYIIIDEINDRENKYIYLSNINDSTDICIRKTVKKDNNEYFEALKDEEELKYALELFTNKVTKGE